jgi:hypothetical protein
MTLYTIVSIVIALSGSTFTAITQFSSFFGLRVRTMREDSSAALKFITAQLSDSGIQKRKAKSRDSWIGRFHFIWRIAGLPPVLILLIFAFCTAFRVEGGLGLPNSSELTSDAVSCYRCWLLWVIWVNLAAFGMKVSSMLFVEAFSYFQNQCRQTLIERNPVGQPVVPEITNSTAISA